jgi:uncharacterized protein DUF4349
VSPLELVDGRYDKLARELQAARPAAPDAVRERVRAIGPPPPRRFELNPRRLVPAAGLAVLAAALGLAAVVAVVHGSRSQHASRLAGAAQKNHALRPERALPKAFVPAHQALSRRADGAAGIAAARGRLQRYDAFLRVRVPNADELSKKTQDALSFTRRLGGYVVWTRYAAPARRGDAELSLRIPVDRVQEAIGHFSGYGSLLRQRVVLRDLQRRVDALTGRMRLLQREIARLELQLAGSLTTEQRLQRARGRLAVLRGAKAATVRRAQFARVALTMVTGPKPSAASGRFDRTLDEAGSVLVRELEVLLYALIIAGPLLILGGLALAGARVQRRRADQRLLERT